MTAGRPAAPGRIFISYRREETGYPAGWLFERLAEHFGESQVFKDVDSIQLGDDFVEVITAAVGSCDVLLALIGDRWLTITGEDGRRRLDNPHDYVRLEIEAALKRNIRVIPILVEGARMPRTGEVPRSLAKLVRRQALELSPSRFKSDTGRLLRVLDLTLTEVRLPSADTSRGAAVPALPAEHDSDIHRGRVSAEAPEGTSSANPASLEPSAPDAVNSRRTPEDGEHAPMGDRQRRRVSRRAGILAGAGVGAGLVVVIVVMLASSHAKAPPAGAASRAASPAVIFRDDFSGRANGWTVVVGDGGYSDGTYHISAPSSTLVALAIPENASKLSPSAPQNLSIDVTARSLADPGHNNSYGIACRQGPWGAYVFLVGDQVIYAEKWMGGFTTEHDMPNTNFVVSARATNQLRAACTSEGQRSVHLVFWVNGKKVADWTDTRKPFLKGTVGLVDSSLSNTKPTKAEFDNFVIRKA